MDTASGEWYLVDPQNGQTTKFFYGNPGDLPFVGDWDCDGDETPGLYRQSDGFVYLRNSNTQGIADIRFFFGNPGDIPLAGDFDNDTCDTVGIWRPSEGKVYIINELGANDGGLGAAEFSYFFGNPGDKPFVGDFDNDGVDEIGLHRESTGLVYFRLTHTQGIADASFIFGNPGDKIVAANWLESSGPETVGLFRSSNCTMFVRHTNTQGVADESFVYGRPAGLPVAGNFGVLDGGGAVPLECPPPPPPVLRTFGNGIWRVGIDISAETYRSRPNSGGCYGARVAGFTGSLDDIIANDFTFSPAIVTLSPTDAGFESDGCSQWTNNLAPITGSPTGNFGPGYFFVGYEVAPGLWRNNSSSGGCYWERLSGFSWELDDIIDNSFSFSIQTVQILPSDEGFHSEGCGTWTYLGS